MLGVLKPFNGGSASAGDGARLAPDMPSREAVDAFHAKALALGGSLGSPAQSEMLA